MDIKNATLRALKATTDEEAHVVLRDLKAEGYDKNDLVEIVRIIDYIHNNAGILNTMFYGSVSKMVEFAMAHKEGEVLH